MKDYNGDGVIDWLDELDVEWVKKETVEDTQPSIPEKGILLERKYYDRGTHGVMTFADGEKFYTLELPWLDNERRISCIPEGIYNVKMRSSPLITRLTKNKYTRGWEVTEVKNRDYIMIHQGNYVRNSNGCILLGNRQDFQGNDPVVWDSVSAFERFMKKMQKYDTWQILIEGIK